MSIDEAVPMTATSIDLTTIITGRRKTYAFRAATSNSTVADDNLGRLGNCVEGWSTSNPTSDGKHELPKTFNTWATHPAYAGIVAGNEGSANAPSGTRRTLHEGAESHTAVPFAKAALEGILPSGPKNPTILTTPYTRMDLVARSKFDGISNHLGQQFSGANASNQTAEETAVCM